MSTLWACRVCEYNVFVSVLAMDYLLCQIHQILLMDDLDEVGKFYFYGCARVGCKRCTLSPLWMA